MYNIYVTWFVNWSHFISTCNKWRQPHCGVIHLNGNLRINWCVWKWTPGWAGWQVGHNFSSPYGGYCYIVCKLMYMSRTYMNSVCHFSTTFPNQSWGSAKFCRNALTFQNRIHLWTRVLFLDYSAREASIYTSYQRLFPVPVGLVLVSVAISTEGVAFCFYAMVFNFLEK